MQISPNNKRKLYFLAVALIGLAIVFLNDASKGYTWACVGCAIFIAGCLGIFFINATGIARRGRKDWDGVTKKPE